MGLPDAGEYNTISSAAQWLISPGRDAGIVGVAGARSAAASPAVLMTMERGTPPSSTAGSGMLPAGVKRSKLLLSLLRDTDVLWRLRVRAELARCCQAPAAE